MLMNDLSKHTSLYRDRISAAQNRVLDRAWFILGPEVAEFEKEFAQYLGTRECRTVGNGNDALELALRALGIEQNDQVATVANAGFYTSTALSAIGAVPVYLDVNRQSRVAEFAEVRRAVSNGVKAVVITHLYGQAVPETQEIAEFCRAKGVGLVEDCAQAHGAKLAGKMVGTFGDVGCYSFYPTKNLGALGDGGAVATDNAKIAGRVSQLRQYGWSAKYRVELAGARDTRMDEMQAAILREFLPLLDEWNGRRRRIAQQYKTSISHPKVVLPTVGGEDYVAHLYVICTPQRDSLGAHLRAAGISTDIHYPIPDHRQPVFAGRFAHVHLPITEQLASETLSLPCYPAMSDADVVKVADAINAWSYSPA